MSASADASSSGSGHGAQGSVWVFNGLGANGQHHVWPAVVFTTYQKATAWVASAGVHGTLTEMPLDESTYEHAVRTGRFNPHEPVDRVLLQTFSSSLEHEHYLPDSP